MEAQYFLKWKQFVVIDSIGLILFTVPSIDAIFTTLDQMRVQNGLAPEQILPVWTNFCSPSTAALLDAEQGVAWLWAQVASANPLYWGRVGSRTFCYSSPTALRSAFLTSSYISMVSPERYVSPTAQHANSMARFNPWAGTFYNANNRSNWSLNWCVTRKRTKVAHSDPFAGCLASCGPYFVHPKEDRQHPQSQTVATVVVEIVEHVGLKIDDLAPLLSLYVALVVLFCLGAFHRVYEKIMQHFDSTTSNFNGTFLVLPFEEVHRHSNMSCISGFVSQALRRCSPFRRICFLQSPWPFERLFLGAETISLPGHLERAGVAMNPWTTERCGGICRVSYKSGASFYLDQQEKMFETL